MARRPRISGRDSSRRTFRNRCRRYGGCSLVCRRKAASLAAPGIDRTRVMTMQESDKAFTGSIPENYDRHMVPLIFEPFAADLARRAASLSPGVVLEVAAGTGVVTRALAPKLSPGASYMVT